MPKFAFTRHLNRPLLGRYSVSPIELFRVNPKPAVFLRNRETQRSQGLHSFDLQLASDGLVHTRPGPNFKGPNGASMRPMGVMLQRIIRGYREDCVIYRLPKGTGLPETMVLLHKHTDHFSIQTTKPVELAVLNKRITELLWEKAERMTQDEFFERYPFGGGDEYDWVG